MAGNVTSRSQDILDIQDTTNVLSNVKSAYGDTFVNEHNFQVLQTLGEVELGDAVAGNAVGVMDTYKGYFTNNEWNSVSKFIASTFKVMLAAVGTLFAGATFAVAKVQASRVNADRTAHVAEVNAGIKAVVEKNMSTVDLRTALVLSRIDEPAETRAILRNQNVQNTEPSNVTAQLQSLFNLAKAIVRKNPDNLGQILASVKASICTGFGFENSSVFRKTASELAVAVLIEATEAQLLADARNQTPVNFAQIAEVVMNKAQELGLHGDMAPVIDHIVDRIFFRNEALENAGITTELATAVGAPMRTAAANKAANLEKSLHPDVLVNDFENRVKTLQTKAAEAAQNLQKLHDETKVLATSLETQSRQLTELAQSMKAEEDAQTMDSASARVPGLRSAGTINRMNQKGSAVDTLESKLNTTITEFEYKLGQLVKANQIAQELNRELDEMADLNKAFADHVRDRTNAVLEEAQDLTTTDDDDGTLIPGCSYLGDNVRVGIAKMLDTVNFHRPTTSTGMSVTHTDEDQKQQQYLTNLRNKQAQALEAIETLAAVEANTQLQAALASSNVITKRLRLELDEDQAVTNWSTAEFERHDVVPSGSSGIGADATPPEGLFDEDANGLNIASAHPPISNPSSAVARAAHASSQGRRSVSPALPHLASSPFQRASFQPLTAGDSALAEVLAVGMGSIPQHQSSNEAKPERPSSAATDATFSQSPEGTN